jgi:bifunctional DNA primase/polymerase-like protein
MSVNGDVVAAAVEAVERGESLIATKLDKKPLGPWAANQERPASVEQVQAWARNLDVAGFAVVTGSVSGLVVLDFDGESAREFLVKLELVPHVKTPHGYHLRLQHPGFPVKTLNSKAKHELGERWPGVDIRADGGYAIEWGKSQFGEYRRTRNLGELEALDRLPTDLRDFLGLLKPPPPSVERLLELALEQRGRNNGGFWLACQLRDNGYAFNEAQLAVARYVERCGPLNTEGEPEPYTVEDAHASLRQAYKVSPREAWANRPKRERKPLEPDEAETLRNELTARLQLSKADLTVLGTEMSGTTSNAVVRIHLSNGDAIEVERFADVFSPTRFKPCVVAIIGRAVKLSGDDCSEIAALIVQLSEYQERRSMREDARDWGIAFLGAARIADVDIDNQASKWEAFSAIKELDPIAIARQTGLSVASKSLVLRDGNGARYVHSNWFAAHVRRDMVTQIANDALIARMVDAGWERRGRRGRFKATSPRMSGELQVPFYVVPPGWEDDE